MATLLGNEFAERYRSLSDGELLSLAYQREQLASAASAALNAELATRGLGPDAIRAFEDQTAAKVEPENEDPKTELAPPCELPDDWFDERADESTGSIASLRPKGVTVCALSFWSSGILMAACGAWAILQDFSVLWLLIGLLAMIVGVVHCVIGSGLWRITSWSRNVAEVFCWFYVAAASVSIMGNAYMRLHGFSLDPTRAIWQFMGLLWDLLWALYLRSEGIRRAFLAANQERESRRTQTT